MTMTVPEVKCQLFRDHEGDHDPIYEVHKCQGSENCLWCVPEDNRCEYELVMVEVWVREEKVKNE